MIGQIAVYDATRGIGIIILENKEKINFDISQWDEVEAPKLYDEVFIENIDNLVIRRNIKIISNSEKLEKLFKLIEPNFIKIGFIIKSSSKNEIELIQEEKSEETFGIFKFIIFTFIYTLLLWLIFGAFSILVSLIISFFLSKSKEINKPFINIKLKIIEDKIESSVNGNISKIEYDLEKEEIGIFLNNQNSVYIINNDGIKFEKINDSSSKHTEKNIVLA